MEFLTIINQQGESCDYTIGCGTKCEVVEADSVEDAQEKILYPDGRDEQSILEDSETSYKSIYIVPMEYVTSIDIESIKARIKAFEEKLSQKQLSDDEAEFERLRRKLNK